MLPTTDQLKERFAQINRSHEGFCSVKYLGIRTVQPPTDFAPLRGEVTKEIQKTDVRSTRPLHVVFKLLQVNCFIEYFSFV